jgi:hypothetical protein
VATADVHCVLPAYIDFKRFTRGLQRQLGMAVAKF